MDYQARLDELQADFERTSAQADVLIQKKYMLHGAILELREVMGLGLENALE